MTFSVRFTAEKERKKRLLLSELEMDLLFIVLFFITFICIQYSYITCATNTQTTNIPIEY